jgi:hypothetical protein
MKTTEQIRIIERQIIKGNKLIAEFMVIKNVFEYIMKDGISLGLYIAEDEDGSIDYSHVRINFIKYHSSWDWLIPVVSKIEESNEFSVIIFKGCCDIHDALGKYKSFESIEKGGGQPKILSTYQAVIEFIKWYNKNNK